MANARPVPPAPSIASATHVAAPGTSPGTVAIAAGNKSRTAQLLDTAAAEKYGQQHERSERRAHEDHDRRGDVVDRDLDEEVRRAPERGEEQEQEPGASRHLVAYSSRRGGLAERDEVDLLP